MNPIELYIYIYNWISVVSFGITNTLTQLYTVRTLINSTTECHHCLSCTDGSINAITSIRISVIQ